MQDVRPSSIGAVVGEIIPRRPVQRHNRLDYPALVARHSVAHERAVRVSYQHNSLWVRPVVLDGLVDQAREESDIVHLGAEQVAAGLGGVPEPHAYDIHSAVWGEQQVLVLVDTVIQAHPPSVEKTGTGVPMQTDDQWEGAIVDVPARHGKRRGPPLGGECGSGVLVGVVDWAVAIV